MSILRLGVSSYSYWHFTPEKYPIEKVIDNAQALGLLGVEMIHQQLESEDNSYLQKLKRHAFRRGISLYSLGTSQDFVWDDAEKRQANVAHTKHCIDLAHAMGVPSIRVNAGTWRRDDNFANINESKGWSTPWEGSSQEEGLQWAVDGLGACLDYAAECGVMLLLENHWGLTTYPEGMLHILDTLDSPWLRAILDMGNFYFCEDMYAAMERLAPYVDVAHAKTYPGGGLVFTIPLDFVRIFRILQGVGFGGYVSIEMEGKEAADTAVPSSITLLQQAWQEAQV